MLQTIINHVRNPLLVVKLKTDKYYICRRFYEFFIVTHLITLSILFSDFSLLTCLCYWTSLKSIKPRPNKYNISYNIIQLWCFMKCCTRLATLLYVVLSCCILLYEVWSRSNFSLNKCCTIQHFFCFPRCCMMLYSFGHPMQLCCTRACAAEVIFLPHSFVDFVFEDMFNR